MVRWRPLSFPLFNTSLIMWGLYSEFPTVAERAQRAANRKNACKKLHQFDNTHAANAHNTTKQTKALQVLTTQPQPQPLQIKSFIWLCCEHLQHLLSNWWRCFLDFLVLFLFACVFWSCSALSSLGHRSILLRLLLLCIDSENTQSTSPWSHRDLFSPVSPFFKCRW